jgi:hypothetical protein
MAIDIIAALDLIGCLLSSACSGSCSLFVALDFHRHWPIIPVLVPASLQNSKHRLPS